MARIGDGEEREKTGGERDRRKNPEAISYPSGWRFALFLPEDLIALSQPKTSTVQPKILTAQPKVLTVHPRTESPPQDENHPKVGPSSFSGLRCQPNRDHVMYEVDFIGSVLKGKMRHLGPLLRTRTNANMRQL